MRSPAVTGTPNGNDFPTGKTTRYTYSSGFGDPRLNHNLLSVTAPNEVATAGRAAHRLYLHDSAGAGPGSRAEPDASAGPTARLPRRRNARSTLHAAGARRRRAI